MTSFDFQIKDLKPLFPILIISLLLKLALSAMLPMTADETYYWVWSHHMQLSYFDHPPAVAWLFWLTQPLENFGGAARWAGVVLSQGSLILWLLILKPVMNLEQLRTWLLLALLSPLIGAGSMIITPDIPLLFTWPLTLLMFLRWTEQPTLSRAFWVGICCGLGFCSKYVIVLEPLFLFLGCWIVPSWRSALKKGWWMVLIGLVMGSMPVWLWNYLQDFASFKFQANHGLGRDWKPSWTYEYVLLQIALLFPPIVYWAVRNTKRAPLWLSLLGWGPLAFFALTSFKGYVEANWPIVSYAEILALAVLSLPKGMRAYRVTIGVWASALVALSLLITTRWSPTGEPIKTKEFFQFESLRQVAATHDPVFARSYQMASQLSFDLKKPVYKLRGMNRRDFYDFLEESLPDGDRFYVIAEKNEQLPPGLNPDYGIVQRMPIKEDSSNTFELWKVEKLAGQ